MSRDIEFQPKGVLTEAVYFLREDGLEIGPLFRMLERNVAIEIGDERTFIADRSHDRRNLRRVFDAGRRLPARLPARSDVRAKTDSFE